MPENNETYAELDSYCAYKVSTWKDVWAVIFADLPAPLQAQLKQLKAEGVVTSRAKHPSEMGCALTDPRTQYIIQRPNGKTYFVDTGGNSYFRYIVRVDIP